MPSRVLAAGGEGPRQAPVLINPGDRTNSDSPAYPQAVLNDAPSAYWRLEEAASPVLDTVGAANGTLGGTVSTGEPGALADGTRGMRFDGIDGTRVTIPNTAAIAAINGSTALTMEAWIKPGTAPLPSGFRIFYSFPGSTASYLGTQQIGGVRRVILALWISGRQRYFALGPALAANQWYHVVGTYDGASLVLYINGAVAGQMTGLSGAVTIGTSGVMLGGYPVAGNNYSFEGVVDEAALYSYALTPAQVASHYAQHNVGGVSVALQLSASDIDGDAITYGATGLPSELTLDTNTGLISGTLTRVSAGVHQVTVSASDGLSSDQKSFTWTITHVNHVPALTNPGARSAAINSPFALQLSGSDPDADPLTFSAAGLPPTLSINPSTGAISGNAPAARGTYPVVVTTSDGTLSASQSFVLTVTSPNRAPSLINPGDQTSSRSVTYGQTVLADRPTGYWKLDEVTGLPVTDSAGISSARRTAAVVPDQPGGVAEGRAMLFNGQDTSRVSIDDTVPIALLNWSNALTLEAWINPQSVSPTTFRMFYSFPGMSATYLGTYTVGGVQRIIVAMWINGRQRWFVAGPALAVGSWYHVVASYDGSKLTLYVNGAAVGQLTGLSGSAIINRGGILLGGYQTSGYGFNGLVDEAALYGTALTPSQVALHYYRRSATGMNVALQLSGSDEDGNPLTYQASGLPPGLTIDPATGLISGAITAGATGTYQVSVTVSDGDLTDTQAFVWTVTDVRSYTQAMTSAAPVAYWRLGDGAGTAVLDSAGTNHGTRVGGIQNNQPGAVADGNSSMRFDGVDGTRAAIPATPAISALNNSSAISMEAWINPQTSSLPTHFRIYYSFPGNPASYLGTYDGGGSMRVIVALWINGRQRAFSAGPTLSVGSWYHTVATYDGSRLCLYVNGVLAGQLTGLSGPVLIGSSGVYLGGYPNAGNYGFNGMVDDAALYSYALSPAQVATHYALRRTSTATGLTLTADRTAPMPTGQQVTFTATPAGVGTAAREYKWLLYQSTGGWRILRDWDPASSYTWSPITDDPNAWMMVWTRSAGDPVDSPEQSAELPFPVFTFSTATTSTLIAPADGGTLDRAQPVSWVPIANAQAYRLQLGRTPGGADLLDSGETQLTSYDPTLLPTTQLPTYVAWQYNEGEAWAVWGYGMLLNGEHTDFGAPLTVPCPSGVQGELCYQTELPPLDSTATHDVAISAYNMGGETFSAHVTVPPMDNVVYARLWTKHGGAWRYVDSTFFMFDGAARLVYPVASAVNVDLSQPLRWNSVPNADQYSLAIGTTVGGSDVLNLPNLTGTSVMADTLPGFVWLHARLGTRIGSVWRYTDSRFAGAPPASRLIYPAQGMTNVPGTAMFWWTPVPAVEAFILRVGTTPGGTEVYDSGELMTTYQVVSGLPPDTTLYARLLTRKGGVWRTVDSTFSTAPTPAEASGGGSQTLATIISPADRGQVTTDRMTVTWTPVPGAAGYHIRVGSVPGGIDEGMSAYSIQETTWTSDVLPRGLTLYIRLFTQLWAGDTDHYVDIVVTTSLTVGGG